MSKVYVLVGVPGSGKSTFADKQDATIISSDKVRKALYGDEAVQGDNEIVFNIYYERAFRALKTGKDIILDATNLTIKSRKSIFDTLKTFNDIEYVAVYFDVPLEVCLERNANRERRVPEKVIRRYFKQMQKPSLEEGFDKILVLKGESNGE